MSFGGKSGLQIDTQYQVGQAVTVLNVTPDHTYSIGGHSQQTSQRHRSIIEIYKNHKHRH